jgi:hypothetical protein
VCRRRSTRGPAGPAASSPSDWLSVQAKHELVAEARHARVAAHVPGARARDFDGRERDPTAPRAGRAARARRRRTPPSWLAAPPPAASRCRRDRPTCRRRGGSARRKLRRRRARTRRRRALLALAANHATATVVPSAAIAGPLTGHESIVQLSACTATAPRPGAAGVKRETWMSRTSLSLRSRKAAIGPSDVMATLGGAALADASFTAASASCLPCGRSARSRAPWPRPADLGVQLLSRPSSHTSPNRGSPVRPGEQRREAVLRARLVVVRGEGVVHVRPLSCEVESRRSYASNRRVDVLQPLRTSVPSARRDTDGTSAQLTNQSVPEATVWARDHPVAVRSGELQRGVPRRRSRAS